MTYVNVDLVKFLCEKLEELRDSNETAEQKSQRYNSDFRQPVNQCAKELQERATMKGDPSVLLVTLADPVLHLEAILKLLRHLISHQPEEDV
jgi:hypothetical protein